MVAGVAWVVGTLGVTGVAWSLGLHGHWDQCGCGVIGVSGVWDHIGLWSLGSEGFRVTLVA